MSQNFTGGKSWSIFWLLMNFKDMVIKTGPSLFSTVSWHVCVSNWTEMGFHFVVCISNGSDYSFNLQVSKTLEKSVKLNHCIKERTGRLYPSPVARSLIYYAVLPAADSSSSQFRFNSNPKPFLREHTLPVEWADVLTKGGGTTWSRNESWSSSPNKKPKETGYCCINSHLSSRYSLWVHSCTVN